MHHRAFTLIEIILAMTILSFIVMSVFVVFDRSMEVMDTLFNDSYRFEEVKKFFHSIRKQLESSTASKNEEVYHFIGGPHWIEFATPLTEEISIQEYIQRGVNQLSKTTKKVHYFGAQVNVLGDDGDTHRLTHVYRLIPNSNAHDDILYRPTDTGAVDPTQIDTESEVTLPAEVGSGTFLPVNTWLESEQAQTILKNNDFNKTYLKDLYSLERVLTCKSLSFRYLYTVSYEDSSSDDLLNVYYSQDWWSSRLRYPDFPDATDAQANFEKFYTYFLYDDNPTVIGIEKERHRRYSDPDNLWVYENEPVRYRAFTQPSGGSYGIEWIRNNYSAQRKLENGDEVPDDKDPWFTQVPSSVQVTVVLYDPLKPDQKGDTFTSSILLRTQSSAVFTYYSGLLNE